MSERRRIVIIGGVAAGPKAAARARRLAPTAEITIIEKGKALSYAGCGLPYFISGDIYDETALLTTPLGVPRDAAYFETYKGIAVRMETEAVRIDRGARAVDMVHLPTGERSRMHYDTLILATGSCSVEVPIPGTDLPNVFELKTLEDAVALRDLLKGGKALRAAIVGGGLIGLEMAETLKKQGCSVTLIELYPHILPTLDTDIALLVEGYMRSLGMTLMTGSKVERLEGDASGAVARVVTDATVVPADLVLMSVGVRPNVELARQAGLIIGPHGGIHVDSLMRTSDPNILAVGDCIEKMLRVAGTSVVLPMGSAANKEGRVAGTNAVTGGARYPGVMGTVMVKVFDWNIGRAGLSSAQARQLGLSVATTVVSGPDRAHYYPGAKSITVKLVVDRADRKILGIQAVGLGDVAKRIDVAVTAMSAGMTVDDVSGLDLAYAPPYAPAMDVLITAADSARNQLDGLLRGISSEGLQALREAEEDMVLLDVRSPQEFARTRIPHSVNVPLGELRKRADEVPRNRPVIVVCQAGSRAYEASCYLRGEGYTNVSVLCGGLGAWPFDRESPGPQSAGA